MVEILVIVPIVEASPLSNFLNDIGHGSLFRLWLLEVRIVLVLMCHLGDCAIAVITKEAVTVAIKPLPALHCGGIIFILMILSLVL